MDRPVTMITSAFATHELKMAYTIYPGVGHNAWDKAYSVTPDQDELLKWITSQFELAPRPVEKQKLIESIKNF